MEKIRKIPPIYQDYQNIDIHIDFHPSGHKYEIDFIGNSDMIRKC